jgi:hypothetical protein
VYGKVSGPTWLTVASNGRISGVPSLGDAGINRFIVRATDPTLLADDAVVNLVVGASGGLLAHYQFEGNTADNSGGGAGVATGGPAYETGLFDRAIRLDGADDFVRLPAGLVDSLADITIAARVRWDGGGTWQRIFDFGNNTSQYMVLSPRTGPGTLRFTISLNGNAAGAEQILETAPLPIGEWTHVAVSLIGNTGTLYVNGAAVDTRTITLDPSSLAPVNNYLGKSQFADPLFNGLIDDFRIYNRGLTSAEVLALAVPPPAVLVPDPSFAGWASNVSFPAGEAGPQADPDRDGVPNLFEYLSGSDPLAGSIGALPQSRVMTAGELGLPTPGKTYLTLRARVRKLRPGVTLIPEAAASVQGLAEPAASSYAVQAGAPVLDGDHETFTYYYKVPLEDSPTGAGAMRLRAVLDQGS